MDGYVCELSLSLDRPTDRQADLCSQVPYRYSPWTICLWAKFAPRQTHRQAGWPLSSGISIAHGEICLWPKFLLRQTDNSLQCHTSHSTEKVCQLTFSWIPEAPPLTCSCDVGRDPCSDLPARSGSPSHRLQAHKLGKMKPLTLSQLRSVTLAIHPMYQTSSATPATDPLYQTSSAIPVTHLQYQTSSVTPATSIKLN